MSRRDLAEIGYAGGELSGWMAARRRFLGVIGCRVELMNRFLPFAGCDCVPLARNDRIETFQAAGERSNRLNSVMVLVPA